MAVENKYVDANIVAGKKPRPALTSGQETVSMTAIISVAAADDDLSVYRAFPSIPSSWIPLSICVQNSAITAGTSYDVGLYKTNGGAVVDKDVLAATLDMSSARTVATWNNAGLTSVALADTGKTLGVLSAQTDADAAYDIAVTANTVGSAAGTIVLKATFLQG